MLGRTASIAVVLLWHSISPADAENLCDAVSNTNTKWPQITKHVDAALGRKSHKCGNAMGMDGAYSQYCYWAFEYRSEYAYIGFDLLREKLSQCRLGQSNLRDKSVNHPDTFTLEKFAFDTRDIVLSYKDKVTLEQSLIFVHLRQKPDS